MIRISFKWSPRGNSGIRIDAASKNFSTIPRAGRAATQ